MMKKDEAKKTEEEHQRKVSQMIKSADGRTRFAAQDHQADGVEWSADIDEGRRRRQADGQMRIEERVGKALAK